MKNAMLFLGAFALAFLIIPFLAFAVSADATGSVTVSAGVGVETRTQYGTVGESFMLTSSAITSDRTGRSYSWKQVSGSSEFSYEAKSESTVAIVPQAAGTYVFELVATDVTGASSVVDRVSVSVSKESDDAIFCTQDARQCPNGSWVGRTGPNCEFAACPSEVAPIHFDNDTEAMEDRGHEDDSTDDRMSDGSEAKAGGTGINIGAGMMNDVSIKAAEVRGWDPEKKEAFLAIVKSHAEVASGQDLENFAKGVLLKDENVADIEVDSDEVTVTYRGHGRLFGFIPHAFTEVITVKASDVAEERVKVRFPWYRFMLQSDVSANEIAKAINDGFDKEGIVFNPLATGGTVDASVEGNVSVFAQVLESISNVLKTKHDTVKNSVNNVR